MDILKRCYKLRNLTVNLCSFDSEIPKPTHFPTVFIINTDPVGVAKTEHWFSIFVSDKKHIYYFDSFGVILNPIYKQIKQWGNGFEGVVYNKLLVQNPFSQACGLYCVCFTYWMTCGFPFCKFLELFSEDWAGNDRIIEDFFTVLANNGD